MDAHVEGRSGLQHAEGRPAPRADVQPRIPSSRTAYGLPSPAGRSASAHVRPDRRRESVRAAGCLTMSSRVIALMSMSLDGFVADPDDGVEEVFDWYFNSGDVEIHTGGSDPVTFKVSEPSARHLRALAS